MCVSVYADTKREWEGGRDGGRKRQREFSELPNVYLSFNGMK